MSDDDYDDDDLQDDEALSSAEPILSTRVRNPNAWRSIERYREMKELRKHLDDYFFEDMPERQMKDLYHP